MWRKVTTGHADNGTGDAHPSPHSTSTASASPPLSAAAGRTATHRWPLRTLFPSSTAPSQAALSQQYQLHKKMDTVVEEVDDGDEDEWGEVAPANASLYFSSPTAMTVAAASAAAAGAAGVTRHVAGGGHSSAQVRALPATDEEGESENATSAPAASSQALTHFSSMDHVRQRHGGPVAVPSRRPLGAVGGGGGGRETLWSGSSSHGALGAPVLAKEENKEEDEAEDEWGETVQPSRLTSSLPSHSAPQLRTLPGAPTTTQALPLLPPRHSPALPSTQTQLKNNTDDDIFASEDAALAHPHHGTPGPTRQHERTAAASLATPTQLARPTATATAVSATPAAVSAKSASPAPYTPAPAAFHSGIRGLRPSHDSGSAVNSDAICGLGERGKKKKKGLGAVALLSDTPLTSSTRTPLLQNRESSSPLATAHQQAERLRLEAEEAERLQIEAEEEERLRLEAEEDERLRIEAEQAERLRLEAEEAERHRLEAEEAERHRLEAEEAERHRLEAEEAERLRIEAEEAERLRIEAEEEERLRLEAEEAERLRIEAEQAERLRQEAEEAERLRLEAEEAERLRLEAEEAERLRLEAEEAERLRIEAEEAERLRIEAEEAECLRLEAEEAERLRLEAEEAERLRQEAEEAERLRREAEEAERLRLEAEEAERLRQEAEQEERLRQEAEQEERLRLEAEEAERLRQEAEEAERHRIEAEEAAAPPTAADTLEGVVVLLTELSAPERSKQVQGSNVGVLVRALEDAEEFLTRHKLQESRASADPVDCYRELLRCLLHKAQAKQDTNATRNSSVALTRKVHQSIALLCVTWSKVADAMPAAWGWAWEAALHRPALTLSPDQPQRRSAMRHLALAVEEVGTCALVGSPLWTPAERVASALVAHLVQWAQQVIEDEPSKAGEAPAQRSMASFTVATLPPLRSHTEPGQPFTLQDVHACVLAALQEALSASHDVLLPDGEDVGVGIDSWVKPLLDCVALATLLRDEAVKSEATLATWRHASGSAEEAADAEVHAEAALSVAQQQLREGSWVVWYVLRVVGLLSWWDTTQLLLRPPPASLGWAMKL